MANYTQAQCDASTLDRKKLIDGSWQIFGVNGDNQPLKFIDSVSAGNASIATSKTNAHLFMKESYQYVGTPEDLSTEPESI